MATNTNLDTAACLGTPGEELPAQLARARRHQILEALELDDAQRRLKEAELLIEEVRNRPETGKQ